MRLAASIQIARPPTSVFDYLAHHENHVDFVEENVRCEQIDPGPMAVGSRVKNVARIMGREMVELFEVTAFERPWVIEKASRAGSSFETTDRFELSPRGDGTRVEMTVTGRARSVPERLLFVLLRPILLRSMRRCLGRLKRILEARTKAHDGMEG